MADDLCLAAPLYNTKIKVTLKNIELEALTINMDCIWLNLKNSDKLFLKFVWSYMKVWLIMLRNHIHVQKVMIYQKNIIDFIDKSSPFAYDSWAW